MKNKYLFRINLAWDIPDKFMKGVQMFPLDCLSEFWPNPDGTTTIAMDYDGTGENIHLFQTSSTAEEVEHSILHAYHGDDVFSVSKYIETHGAWPPESSEPVNLDDYYDHEREAEIAAMAARTTARVRSSLERCGSSDAALREKARAIVAARAKRTDKGAERRALPGQSLALK